MATLCRIFSTLLAICPVSVWIQSAAQPLPMEPTPAAPQTQFQSHGLKVDLQPGTRVWILPKGIVSLQAPICYTMQTYQFARETSHSNAMTLVRHTTCQPSPQFQISATTASAPIFSSQ